MNTRQLITVRVHEKRVEAENIYVFDLHPTEDTALPAFAAGAHIEILMKVGLERSYSLVNAPDETSRYVIAVARDPASRGGSAFLCDTVLPGHELQITRPSNNFALEEGVRNTVLIAGGIGITPIWSMLQRLEQIKGQWKLFYAARTRRRAAFLTELLALQSQYSDRVHIVFDHEPNATGLSMKSIILSEPVGTHFYACGPTGLLTAFETATSGLNPATIHFERFSSGQALARGGFVVTLAKSQQSFLIPADKTIMEVLLSEGVDVNRSCMIGVCGTCETPVLEGIPDHRDSVLSRREREANNTIIICCSGSKGAKLVLDM